MSKILDLKDSISTLLSKNTVYTSGSALVPKLDYKELEVSLDPVSQGRKRGEQKIPSNDATLSDEVELKILNTFQEICDKTFQDVNETLAGYNQRILSFDLSSYMDNVRDATRSSVSDFKSEVVKGLNELKNDREKVKNKFNDLNYFKEENKIKRSASYPTTTKLWMQKALLALLFLIESIGNSIFLSSGHLGGLLGAYTESFAISFLNVGSAFLIGRFLTPYMFCRYPPLRLFAVVVFFAFLSVSGFLNLAVAHYRDMAGAGLFADAGSLAIVKLANSPFGLDEFQSWILFFVGWLLWILAVIDTHSMDDSIPGYGPIDRALRDARDQYSDLKGEIINEIQNLRLDGEDQVKDIRNQLSDVHGQANAIYGLRRALLKDYEVFTDQANRYFLQILESYRSANTLARLEQPKSFSKVLSLSIVSLTDEDATLNLEMLSDQVNEGKKALDAALDNFYRENSEAIETFQKLDDIETSGFEKVENIGGA